LPANPTLPIVYNLYKDDLKFLETVADPDLVSFFKFILIAMVTRRMG